MSLKMKNGTCVNCGAQTKIKARGMCSGCYARQWRGDTNVDCFALDIHSRVCQCTVMGGNCIKIKGLPCEFHRTEEEHRASSIKAMERINALPIYKQKYIIETYFMQREYKE